MITIKEAVQSISQNPSRQTDILEQCRDNYSNQEKTLNAFITETYDRKNERTGQLKGIPIAIKDNIAVENIKLSCGSKMLGNYKSLYSADAVEKLENAGTLIIGKTNLDEFAMGASGEYSAFGVSRNPIDTSLVPGGSSSGSAVAVASGMALGALGSDTGGSVRQPASFCGLVGIRPTYGTVSRYGLVAFASSLDQIGTMAQTVDDASLLLKVIRGYDPKDATSVEWNPKPIPSVDSITIGIPKQLADLSIDPDIIANLDSSRKVLESSGAKFVDIEIPNLKHSVSTYQLIAPSECSANLSRFDSVRYGLCEKDDDLDRQYRKTRSKGFGEEVRRRILVGTYALSEGFYDAYYIQACRTRAKLSQELFDAFTSCDVILTPTTPTTAFPIGKVLDPLDMYACDMLTIIQALAGVPAISVPTGNDSQGKPIGMQLTGPAFSDDSIADIAKVLERDMK